MKAIKYELNIRGGKICLDIHFAPLWGKNTPKFGIAHALAIGVF
jgi:ufm1-conjugating enzyme 1